MQTAPFSTRAVVKEDAGFGMDDEVRIVSRYENVKFTAALQPVGMKGIRAGSHDH